MTEGEKGPMTFVLRGDVQTRREAVNMAASIRREPQGMSRKKAGIWDGMRLVQPVF